MKSAVNRLSHLVIEAEISLTNSHARAREHSELNKEEHFSIPTKL